MVFSPSNQATTASDATKMSGFRFNRQDSDDEDEYPHPNSRRSMKTKRQDRDDVDVGLPTSCSTKADTDPKSSDFILMLLMIISVAGAIYSMHIGGYTLEIVQAAPTKTGHGSADPSTDVIAALNDVKESAMNVLALSMQEQHDLKSDIKLTIHGGQFEAQHLTLQLMTSEVGDRAKVERAAGIDHIPRMQQGNMLRDAGRR